MFNYNFQFVEEIINLIQKLLRINYFVSVAARNGILLLLLIVYLSEK